MRYVRFAGVLVAGLLFLVARPSQAATTYATYVDTSTGAVVSGFPALNGTISSAVPDGSGGWYLAGAFTQVAGTTRNHLAHVLADNSLDASWNPDVGDIWKATSLALSGTTLYVGGDFETIGGQARQDLAALDAATGTVLDWNPGATYSDYHIDQIIVSGSVVFVRGVSMAALDATTGAVLWNPNANFNVNGMTVANGLVYITGTFTEVAGQARSKFAALDITTGALAAWAPTVSPFQVGTILATESRVYYGGQSTSTSVAGLGALEPTSAAVLTWKPKVELLINNTYKTPPTVNSFVLDGTMLYASGTFDYVGGKYRPGVVALNATTGAVLEWNPNAPGASVIAVADGKVLLSGTMKSFGKAGADSYLPTLTAMKFTKGVYSYTSCFFGMCGSGSSHKFQPFAKYTGGVWGQRVNLGVAEVVVVAPAGKFAQGALRLYDSSYKLKQTMKPFGVFVPTGFTMDSVSESLNSTVYVAAAIRQVGYSVKIYKVEKTKLTSIANVAASTASVKGTIVLKFLKLYSSQNGLVTMVSGKPKTLKVWKYSTVKKTFLEDKSAVTRAKVKVKGDGISLK